ncbi:phosphohydrolase [Halobacteriales archaeon SW_5_70_135]|nr:MAG: phosphohydrolase [Halobacteriales archaeon SW_5_70_135]
MRSIKDSVHDYVEVDGVALDLLDTWPVQRLRHIKQLSTVRLVYPSANHTRFEHSLGVSHLATRALDQLGVEDARADAVRAAALLHDVGHGPYGHQTEPVIERRTGSHHDEVHGLLARTAVAGVLEAHGLDVDRVADLVAGRGRLGRLVSGELDVDRLDYLVRDAHHTGVPYGTIDQGRVLRELTFEGDRLVLDEGTVAAAESVLVARALMNATVYRHHVSRIAGTILERASERLLDSTDLAVAEFARMTDADLLDALAACEATADAARRLTERDLHKRALWVDRDAVPDRLVDRGHDETRELERAIADRAGVEPTAVLVDVPGEPSMPESSLRVVVDGEPRRLDRRSALVEGLRAMERTRWRTGVYAPETDCDAVRDAAVAVLGLDVSPDAAGT